MSVLKCGTLKSEICWSVFTLAFEKITKSEQCTDKRGNGIYVDKIIQVYTDDIFQDEIPPEDKGREFADGDVAVDVGGARLRHSSSELGVAQAYKRNDKALSNRYSFQREDTARPQLDRTDSIVERKVWKRVR